MNRDINVELTQQQAELIVDLAIKYGAYDVKPANPVKLHITLTEEES